MRARLRAMRRVNFFRLAANGGVTGGWRRGHGAAVLSFLPLLKETYVHRRSSLASPEGEVDRRSRAGEGVPLSPSCIARKSYPPGPPLSLAPLASSKGGKGRAKKRDKCSARQLPVKGKWAIKGEPGGNAAYPARHVDKKQGFRTKSVRKPCLTKRNAQTIGRGVATRNS